MSTTNSQIKSARTILCILEKHYPDARIELNYSNPIELLIATILSAQCTDVRVNEVTKSLFKEFTTPEHYVSCKISKLEKLIHPTGFFHQKAKSIRGAIQAIIDNFGGNVPQTMEELTTLPGVGRKTANVILANAYNVPSIPVDTHVIRLSNRLGLTTNQDPVKIEFDLQALFPKKKWSTTSHTLIFHGRRICKARKPDCEQCPVKKLCPYVVTNT